MNATMLAMKLEKLERAGVIVRAYDGVLKKGGPRR
jgi:hypothetical protein